MAYRITHVRTEQPPGSQHPHIAKIKLSDGTVETRSQVIMYIEQYKMTYVTYAPGVPEAKVVVARCPHCGSGDYITTEPDYTTANNLLDLPRF
ncbi:MAG: DUF3892 domain-containing protein [Actinomycetota bacterium]|nr:DUF3892 domain-containing protein [Actinomycetota bacterium]